MIPKENNIIKNKKNTLDKKVWVNIVCFAIGLCSADMIYSLLQGNHISFCNIAGLIVKAGVFILIMYLFYRYRIFPHPIWNNYDSTTFNYHENSSVLRYKWVASIPPLFIVCSLLAGHYIYPKLWNYVIIGLIGGVIALLLRSLVFLFEKVFKMNKVS